MPQAHGDTTSPTLLSRVRDARDDRAWAEFVARYEPLLRQWCRYYRLDPETCDELCQRTWERLWPVMRTYRYDPGRRFRGWLWSFFRSRAADLLAERTRVRAVSLESLPDGGAFLLSDTDRPDDIDEEGGPDGARPAMLAEAEAIQEAVRARVDEKTWRAFWMMRIEGRPPREVAESLGKSYAAVYYGALRVEERLRKEGQRRLGKPTKPGREAEEPHGTG